MISRRSLYIFWFGVLLLPPAAWLWFTAVVRLFPKGIGAPLGYLVPSVLLLGLVALGSSLSLSTVLTGACLLGVAAFAWSAFLPKSFECIDLGYMHCLRDYSGRVVALCMLLSTIFLTGYVLRHWIRRRTSTH